MDNKFKGYALVLKGTNDAFGWYASIDEAEQEQRFQQRVYGRRLVVVKDTEASYPAR